MVILKFHSCKLSYVLFKITRKKNMRRVRSRKHSSATKDGFRQLEIDRYFLTSTKKMKSVSKLSLKKEKTIKSKKQLFNDEIIVIDDENESTTNEELCERNKCTIKKNTHLQLKHADVNVASTSRLVETVCTKNNILTLNRPVAQIGSSEKLKPRVLQSISSQTSYSFALSQVISPCEKSLSQNSTKSDDTVIYDLSEESAVSQISPITRLIEKVDENIQATKFSTVAYIPSEVDPLAQENEPSNPRAVNFITKIIKYVFKQPHLKTLFTMEEIATLERFFSLPRPEYNFLCYKLYTRLPRWYNIFKLCENLHLYMCTNEISNMCSCLANNGFVLTDYSSEPVEQLLNLLTVKEIRQICDGFKFKVKSGQKLQLIEYLLNSCSKQTTLTLSKNSNQILRERINEKLGICVKLSEKLYDLLYRIHLLYALGSSEFSKPHQLYQFIDNIESGNIILPEYVVDTTPIFQSRDEFLDFAKASEYKDEILNAIDSKNRDIMVEIGRVVYKKLQDILKQE